MLVVAGGPETAIALKVEGVFRIGNVSNGNRLYAGGGKLLGDGGVVVGAIAKISVSVVASAPKCALAVEKQTVIKCSGNGADGWGSAEHNPFRQIGFGGNVIAQLIPLIIAHAPEAAVTFN